MAPSKDASKEELWRETWRRIDRFLPDLRSDLALEEPQMEETPRQLKVEVQEKEQDATVASKEKEKTDTKGVNEGQVE